MAPANGNYARAAFAPAKIGKLIDDRLTVELESQQAVFEARLAEIERLEAVQA